jgi:hypothetical protein
VYQTHGFQQDSVALGVIALYGAHWNGKRAGFEPSLSGDQFAGISQSFEFLSIQGHGFGIQSRVPIRSLRRATGRGFGVCIFSRIAEWLLL